MTPTLRSILCVTAAAALGACATTDAAGGGGVGADAEAACARIPVDYAHHWDTYNGAGVAGLFTADGTLELGGRTMTGREAIAARVGNPGQTVIRHLVSNIRVTPEGADAASMTSYVQVLIAPGAAPPVTHPGRVTLGEYHDRCVRTGDGWKLASRKLVPIMTPPPAAPAATAAPAARAQPPRP